MQIYEIIICPVDAPDFPSGQFVSVTEPASVRQIVAALKNEGLVKPGCRYASFMATPSANDGHINVWHNRRVAYTLIPCD